eukprot:CAMPEP_0197520726 /NCGR_PEP_ID=MMETSP1318-20131121/6057_1 /TAXON_ID=552666 /ORGANISM="Partenskyella glossopodia, Strain RCC365" /LENGTH=548 /DNA_ID=CAMNT_0043072429 /DNA_START=329 /DNA_END=1975 /DNA_ORIENTATION=+
MKILESVGIGHRALSLSRNILNYGKLIIKKDRYMIEEVPELNARVEFVKLLNTSYDAEMDTNLSHSSASTQTQTCKEISESGTTTNNVTNWLLRKGEWIGGQRYKKYSRTQWTNKEALWLVSKLNIDAETQDHLSWPRDGHPCGISQVGSLKLPYSGHILKPAKRTSESGPAQVGVIWQMDEETQISHHIREGVALCQYMFASQISSQSDETSVQKRKQVLAPQLTFLIHTSPYANGGETSVPEEIRDWKVSFLKTLGNVIDLDKHPYNKTSPEVEKLAFERLYTTPWEGFPHHGADTSFVKRDQFPHCGGAELGWGKASCTMDIGWLEVDRAPLPLFTGCTRAVRRAILPMRIEKPNYIAFFQRGKSRRIVDVETRDGFAVVQALCEEGLAVEVMEFNRRTNIPFKRQVELMAQSAVMVTSHGTNLYNAIWMAPMSVVIEVSLRVGSCCGDHYRSEYGINVMYDPITNPNPVLCRPHCSPYYLTAPVNYLLASGIRWRYYDPVYTDQPDYMQDQRGARKVYVNSRDLAQYVKAAYVDVRSREVEGLV